MKNIIKIIIIVALLALGFMAGILVRNIPYLSLDNKIGIGDVADFIMAIFIAIILPLVFNQWQDRKRFTKNFLIDELKLMIDELEKIKNRIDTCALNEETTELDIKSVNMYFQCLDIKIHSFGEQIDVSFKKIGSDLKKNMETEYLKYWRNTTGGDLMNQGFAIDKAFCKDHDSKFFIFESYLKKAIHVVNSW